MCQVPNFRSSTIKPITDPILLVSCHSIRTFTCTLLKWSWQTIKPLNTYPLDYQYRVHYPQACVCPFVMTNTIKTETIPSRWIKVFLVVPGDGILTSHATPDGRGQERGDSNPLTEKPPLFSCHTWPVAQPAVESWRNRPTHKRPITFNISQIPAPNTNLDFIHM